jgi:hypothetical protein
VARRRLIVVSVVVAAVVAVSVARAVFRSRLEQEARVVLDQVGVPPGFTPIGATVTGSEFCFGPCFRVHGRYVTDMPFREAIASVTGYLRAQGATKACGLTINCETPLAPEDCRALDDGPVCRTSLVVDGRPLLVSVTRSGPPTELTLMSRPKKDINLFF